MTFATACIAVLRFACWETALFAVSIVLARALGWRGARRVEEKILAVVAIEIVLESSFAALFSFTRINGPSVYWAAAALCALAAVATRHGREALERAAGGLKTAEIVRYPRAAACLAGLLTPLVFLSFHPVQESDSINYLHYLIDWMANRATPYSFATNYVAFWELSFLPSWTVTGLDVFFPLLALKAVALLALAAWLAGRELGLRRHLLLWTVFGAILLRHFWWEPSGVPTLKNDVLHGAGFVLVTLVVLRAVRRRLDRADAALFALGAAFAAVKYTGIFVAALAAAALLFLEVGRRKRLPHSAMWDRRFRLSTWRSALAASSAGLFLLLTSGHYYLHNLLLYGSPFYPFQINFAFLHLPGTADLSGTSILYNLRNPDLWRALFLPAGGISSAGLLFPVVLAAALAASAWLVVRRPPTQRPLPWAGFLLLAGWFLYFRSVYGAGAVPGDLGFVLGLGSLRYVIGVLAVSELLLVAMLWRTPRLALSLVALNAASRAAILYAKLPLGNFPVPAVIAASAAVGLVAWLLVQCTPPAAAGAGRRPGRGAGAGDVRAADCGTKPRELAGLVGGPETRARPGAHRLAGRAGLSRLGLFRGTRPGGRESGSSRRPGAGRRGPRRAARRRPSALPGGHAHARVGRSLHLADSATPPSSSAGGTPPPAIPHRAPFWSEPCRRCPLRRTPASTPGTRPRGRWPSPAWRSSPATCSATATLSRIHPAAWSA